jgi:hypothetical protein
MPYKYIQQLQWHSSHWNTERTRISENKLAIMIYATQFNSHTLEDVIYIIWSEMCWTTLVSLFFRSTEDHKFYDHTVSYI